MDQHIRWKQRFSNYEKALAQLSKFIEKRDLNELEEQGLVQAFEFTHELAWNVMKNYFYYQGNSSITGSRDATRDAFKYGLIEDGKEWMGMISSRNISSHSYNEDTIKELKNQIIYLYYPLFEKFRIKMNSFQ